MPSLVQREVGDLEMEGVDGAGKGVLHLAVRYLATSVDDYVFVATRAMRVKAITGRPTVAGSNGSAVTCVVRKVPDGTALASGTALHSGTYDLKGTINTNQSLTLSTTSSDLDLAAGDAVAIDFTGTLTAAVGCITIALTPK